MAMTAWKASNMEARIPEERLAEQYFAFTHDLMHSLQMAFRQSGLSQKALGERLGKAPETISRCLSGQQNMTIRTMHNLARAMDFRPEINLFDLRALTRTNRRPSPRRPSAHPPGLDATNIYGDHNRSASPGALFPYEEIVCSE
jgi:plasmid maintenance system antidote protein VapI